MDPVYKEGMLYLQGVKFRKKTWKKIWMVLFKPSSCAAGRLEIYTVHHDSGYNSIFNRKTAAWQKTPVRTVVRFCDCLSASRAPVQSCPAGCTPFYLTTTLCTYTLASPLSQDWLSALAHLAFQKDPGELHKGVFDRGNGLTMEDNDLYSSWKTDVTLPPNQYQVTVQSTEASRRCKLAGNYLMATDRKAVLLLDATAGHTVHCWPYNLLRKVGHVELTHKMLYNDTSHSHNIRMLPSKAWNCTLGAIWGTRILLKGTLMVGGFSIEAGRHCDTGDGAFIFLSQQAPEIVRTVSSRCSAEETPSDSSVQPRGIPRESSPVPFLTADPACDHVSTDAEDKSACHYSTISASGALNARPSPLRLHLTCGKEEDENYIEWGQFPEAINQDDAEADSIYYNLRGSTQSRTQDRNKSETERLECVYSDVKTLDMQPKLQSISDICALLKPQCERQPLEKNLSQPEATETPGSFKHRLAEIISQDLARIHSLACSQVGNLTFPH